MATLDVIAVGKIARQLGIASQLVLRVVAEIGIEPPLIVDGVPFFARGDVNRVRCHVAGEAPSDDPESPSNVADL